MSVGLFNLSISVMFIYIYLRFLLLVVGSEATKTA